jgi:Arc/MetJ-type ribon-helix-helix transcriptional regulator
MTTEEDKKSKSHDLGSMLKHITEALRHVGVAADLDDLIDCCSEQAQTARRAKIVCVSPGLRDSLDEMGATTRDQVVMVRVDEETAKAIDAWVETGAVKSRSEAAALFIREGLKVRADELDELNEALREVEVARERLRKRAREVFGDDPPPE